MAAPDTNHKDQNYGELYKPSYIAYDEEHEVTSPVHNCEPLKTGLETLFFTFETPNTEYGLLTQVPSFAGDDFEFDADLMLGIGWEGDKFVECLISTDLYPSAWYPLSGNLLMIQFCGI